MSQTVVITGVGSGLGAALVKKFAREGCNVGMLARSTGFITSLAEELQKEGYTALPVQADITRPQDVERAFAQVRAQLGPVDVLINHAGNAAWKAFTDLAPDDFERSWRVCAYGSFLCSRQAVDDMLKKGKGSILFTGATSAIRGRTQALAFSSAKFAVRGMADSLARELWSKGIHVAHVIIDGVLDTPSVREGDPVMQEEPLMDIDAVANQYWTLSNQEGVWSFEVDLRHHKEEFFT